MSKLVMNYAIAHAIGMDAANRNMRKAGRTVWNEEDYTLAGTEMERVYPVAVELAQSAQPKKEETQ